MREMYDVDELLSSSKPNILSHLPTKVEWFRAKPERSKS